MNKYEQVKELENEISKLSLAISRLNIIKNNPCRIEASGHYGRFKAPFMFYIDFESKESMDLLNKALEKEIEYLSLEFNKKEEQFKALTNE